MLYSSGKEEWLREIFVNNMRNYENQRKLLIETLPPQEVLNVGLIDEKAISNHLTMTNNFKSSYSVYNNTVNKHQTFNKQAPTLAVDSRNSSMKHKKLVKGHLAVCPVKDAIRIL